MNPTDGGNTMQEQSEQVFYEEIREKKTAARGARGRKGKRGAVGKMVTPADLAGSDYRQARELPAFNVYDLLDKLQQAPTLKAVLLSRMDEEYQNYRRATERTLDAVVEVVRLGLEPVYQEMSRLERKVDEALEHVRAAGPAGASQPSAPSAPKRRIRWGSTPEDIRATVFQQLDQLLADGEELSTEVIKQRVPSMLRWIYGERAVFNGIEGLREEFRRARAAATQAAEAEPVGGEVRPA